MEDFKLQLITYLIVESNYSLTNEAINYLFTLKQEYQLDFINYIYTFIKAYGTFKYIIDDINYMKILDNVMLKKDDIRKFLEKEEYDMILEGRGDFIKEIKLCSITNKDVYDRTNSLYMDYLDTNVAISKKQ